MNRRTVLMGLLVAASASVGFGAMNGVAGQAEEAAAIQEDPIFSSLFPPELIMQHRRAIGLSDEQRDAISRLIGDVQGRVTALQWELLDEVEDLASVTGRERVDLDRSIDQLGDVLDKEKEIKQAHLEMLVRIKNLLSSEQQAMLSELRRRGAG